MREVQVERFGAQKKIARLVKKLTSVQEAGESGEKLQLTPRGLPKRIASICPECQAGIEAVLFDQDGRVVLEKTCPNHGTFRDIIYSDTEMYLKMERWTFQDAEGLKNPIVTDTAGCPADCGLCRNHLSTACMTIIDLTNRCNLSCPYCFANANARGYEYSATREQITRMLEKVRSIQPQRCKTIQFSGGEPTIHPDFLWAVAEAKRVGFPYVMIASNGITIGKSLSFARQARAAGLDAVYLQYDGSGDDAYQTIRDANLAKLKQQCLDHCRKAGLRVVLVPTLIKNVNDSQIGSIIRTALDNLDIVNGVSFQPVSFTGRISYDERIRQRFTLSDMAQAVYDQTGLAKPMRDWYPLSFVSPLSRLMEKLSGKDIMTISCHADCGIGCYLIVDRNGQAYPITRFLDLEGAMTELNALADKLRSFLQRPIFFAQAMRIIRKYYRPKLAPPGLSVGEFIGALGPILIRSRSEGGKKRKWRFLVLLGMHFQDLYNYNKDRLKRCVIHYSAPDGRIYPFCVYNSGPLYRERIESRFKKK